ETLWWGWVASYFFASSSSGSLRLTAAATVSALSSVFVHAETTRASATRFISRARLRRPADRPSRRGASELPSRPRAPGPSRGTLRGIFVPRLCRRARNRRDRSRGEHRRRSENVGALP